MKVRINNLTYALDKASKRAIVRECANDVQGEVVIPQNIEHMGAVYAVTKIRNYAFCLCSGLTSFTIPDSVTKIESRAFDNCIGLTSIAVDAKNKVYDSRNDCNAMIETASNTLIKGCKTTIIPDSVTKIGKNAFRGCAGLTDITILNSITEIERCAFYGCTGLTSITIPDSVTQIGIDAFCDCIYEA